MNTYLPFHIKKRVPIVDALRGLALLGIILANVPVYPSSITNDFVLLDSRQIDETINAILHVVISTKFLTIFSILFGFGFYIQLKHASQKGINFRKYFFWRMVLLFIIGCLHAYLLWNGDIIRYYALCGMLLLIFHQLPAEKLLWCAIVILVPLTGITYLLNGLLDLQYSYDNTFASKIFKSTHYSSYLWYNAAMDPLVNFIQDSPLIFITCFGKSMLGYWLGRIGFFFKPMNFASMIKSWIWWGLTLGIGASVGYWAISVGKLEMDIYLVWLPFLLAAGLILHSLLYIAVCVKAFYWPIGKKFLMLFVPIGRMALTNYLLQTIFYLLFFYKWTAVVDVSENLSLADTYLFALSFFILQVLISNFWLRYFSQGPVEWIWKRLSYSIIDTKASMPSDVQREVV